MNEPRRLLEAGTSPMARRLLEAGMDEKPDPSARARTWRACASQGASAASTFDGSARSFSGTLSQTLHLVPLPSFMRRVSGFAGVAALAAACGFSLWYYHGRPAPAPSHYAHEPVSAKLGEKEHLDRAELLLKRGDVPGARRELQRYRVDYPNAQLNDRAELLEEQSKALIEGSSMDTP